MTEDSTRTEAETDRSARTRAIDSYRGASQRAADTLSEAPFLAIAGGIAAGALIAAILPRTESETRAIRPTAKRVRDAARDAASAARETGTQRLQELGLTREKAEETIRSLFQGVTDAAKASGQAAYDSARNRS